MTDLSWFPWSIGATITLGVMAALFKLPSHRGESAQGATFWSIFTMLLLSLLFFHNSIGTTTWVALFWSAVWGINYAILSATQMYALKHVDTNSLYPVTSTSALVLSVSWGLIFFSSQLSWVQLAGIILTIATIYLFLYKGKHVQYSPGILRVGASIIAFSTLGKLAQKIAVGYISTELFQIYTALFGAVFLLIVLFFFDKTNLISNLRGSWRSGVLIGIPAFLGGYLFLGALVRGPFAPITAIHSFYTIITALVAWIFFGEQLTKRKVFLIFLAIVAVLLIRLG